MTTQACQVCGAALQADGLCPSCLLLQAAQTPAPKAPRALPTAAELAQHFPNYTIGEVLGQGGMGVVYAAHQKELDRPVALKLLAPEVAQEPGFAERFRREARVLAALKHPGIVTVYDFGQQGPWFFFAMEKIDGSSLRQLMRERALSARESLAIVSQICEVLQYAHEHGVVHRDIKPENVLVDKAGRVRVLDFGLSKVAGATPSDALTRTDQVMGTPHYMAPEQWERPAEVDHRADIYALGVVFYELLTGELPLGRFEAPSQRVEVDVRLDEIVLRSLAKNPSLRYQQAAEVRTDVQVVQQSSPQTGPAAPARQTATLHQTQLGPAAPVQQVNVLRLPHARIHFGVGHPPPLPQATRPLALNRAQQLAKTVRARAGGRTRKPEAFPAILWILIGLAALSALASIAFVLLFF